MKVIKGLCISLTFTIILLLIITLSTVLLMYTPSSQLPSEYQYINENSDMLIEEYISEFNFGSLQNIRIGEKEVNRLAKTYFDMGMLDHPDYVVNYVYVDFEEAKILANAHLIINDVMDFPMKVTVATDVDYESDELTMSLDYVKAGAVRIPKFILRFYLKANGIESEYLNIDKLHIKYNINEINPYSDFVNLKNILIDDEAIHLEIGMSEYLSENVSDVVNPAAEIVGENLEELYTRLDEEEQASADKMIVFIEENPDIDLNTIDIEKLKQMMDEFLSLSPEVQDTIVESVRNQVDPDEFEELVQIIYEILEK